jgi:hypothetical protein|tara:strand:+ start:1823 stop:2041 length:219 start_codon:yes stop_codon:yes gene_type:complete
MAVTGVTGAGQEVIDEDFAVVDDGDATKKIQWETSGITTGNTITLTAPTSDFNFNNIGGMSVEQGFHLALIH